MNHEDLNNLGDYGEADFNVRKEPLYIQNKGFFDITQSGKYQNIFDNIDSHVAIVRDDTNEPLSIVSKKYKPVTHVKAFKTAEDVIMRSNLNLEGIKRDTAVSHNGARAYSTWTLPEHRVTLRQDDDVALQISSRNSFDGSWSFVVEVGGLRFICLNMQVFANNFAIHKSKHTKGLDLDYIANKLSDSILFYDQETELWKNMVKCSISDKTALEVLAYLANCKVAESLSKRYFGYNVSSILDDKDVIRNKALPKLYDLWVSNKNKLDSTAWALYNAMTEWATHSNTDKKTATKNVASIRINKLDRVRKTLNNKMLPALDLAA